MGKERLSKFKTKILYEIVYQYHIEQGYSISEIAYLLDLTYNQVYLIIQNIHEDLMKYEELKKDLINLSKLDFISAYSITKTNLENIKKQRDAIKQQLKEKENTPQNNISPLGEIIKNRLEDETDPTNDTPERIPK